MSPPRPAEALSVQFVPHIAQGAGFAVQIGGDRGAAGGGEIRAVEADLGQFGAEAVYFTGQGESVGQGAVNLAPETGQGGEDKREAFDDVTGDAVSRGDLQQVVGVGGAGVGH